jgi:hypothetical protein
MPNASKSLPRKTAPAVLEIKDVEDPKTGVTTRRLSINADAIPGRCKDPVLLMLPIKLWMSPKLMCGR